MRCLGSETVALYVAGGLAPGSRASAEAHVDRCPSCRGWIARAARMATHAGSSSTAGEPELGAPHPARGVALGRYRVRGVVGRGAMGVVLIAEDPLLDREVALKLLHRAADDDSGHAALLGEARSLAQLSDPHVIQVFDVGTWCGRMFLAMELVRGSSLRVAAVGRSRRERLHMLSAAGRGLAAAHAAGIVHRDFKPDNVLVADDGRILVGDFGLACALGRGHDTPDDDDDDDDVRSAIVGTPAYMAPEQRAGAPIDARADQFAFCVTAVELLLGFRPRALASSADGVRFAAAARTLPRRLVAALARGLAIDPQRRHHGMDALLLALERAGPSRFASAMWLAPLAVVIAAMWPGAAEPSTTAPTPAPTLAAAELVEIDALIAAGIFENRRSDAAAARAALERAWTLARERRLDEHAARAAIALARSIGGEPAHSDDAFHWLRQAETVLDDASPQRWRVSATRARIRLGRGELADAELDADAALAVFAGAAVDPEQRAEQLIAAFDRRVEDGELTIALEVVDDVVESWCLTGRCSDAVTVSAAMLERLIEEHGPEHGAVSAARVRLAYHQLVTGDFLGAQAELELAIAALEREPAPDLVELAMATVRLAIVCKQLGHTERAYRLSLLSVDRIAQAHGPDSPNLISATLQLAGIERSMGANTPARRHLEWALVAAEQHLGSSHPMVAIVLTDLAGLARIDGDRARALVASERAIALFEARHRQSPEYPIAREIFAWSQAQ